MICPPVKDAERLESDWMAVEGATAVEKAALRFFKVVVDVPERGRLGGTPRPTEEAARRRFSQVGGRDGARPSRRQDGGFQFCHEICH